MSLLYEIYRIKHVLKRKMKRNKTTILRYSIYLLVIGAILLLWPWSMGAGRGSSGLGRKGDLYAGDYLLQQEAGDALHGLPHGPGDDQPEKPAIEQREEAVVQRGGALHFHRQEEEKVFTCIYSISACVR